jgi:hypothetical protein
LVLSGAGPASAVPLYRLPVFCYALPTMLWYYIIGIIVLIVLVVLLVKMRRSG